MAKGVTIPKGTHPAKLLGDDVWKKLKERAEGVEGGATEDQIKSMLGSALMQKFASAPSGNKSGKGAVNLKGLSKEELQNRRVKNNTFSRSVTGSDDGMDADGNSFENAEIDQILASFVGEEQAEEILKKSEEIDDDKRKSFIEDEVKKVAKEKNEAVKDGLKDLAPAASEQYEKMVKDGKLKDGDPMIFEPSSDKPMPGGMCELMQKMGMNVDPRNCIVTYQQSPAGSNPMVKSITCCFVVKPPQQMQNEESNVRKLCGKYGNCLGGEEKEEFDKKISGHAEDAKKDGPLMDVEEFKKVAAQDHKNSFEAAVSNAKNNEAVEAAKDVAQEMRGMVSGDDDSHHAAPQNKSSGISRE